MSDKPNPTVASRILVVEDEMIVATDLSLTLQDLGYEVIGTTRTGELAIELTEGLKPDLVLIDIKLAGEIDGIRASEEIRARFDIPVIFLTGHDETDVISRAKVTEPYGFLAKPISHSALRTTIETVLYKHAADKRVRESEKRYKMLVEQSIDGIGMVQGTTILFVNRAFARIFGFESPAEMVGQNFLNFVAPEYRDLMETIGFKSELGKSVPNFYEFKALRNNGTPFDAELHVNLTTYRGDKVSQGIIRDVTERKKMEEVLFQTEARRAKAEELAGLFSWEWDIRSGRLVRSEGSYRTYGFHSEVTEVDVDSFMDSVHSDDRYLVQKALGDAVDGVRPYDVEYRIVRRDGEERILHSRGEVQRGEKGRAIRMMGMSLDTTDRKNAKERLKKSEERLRTVFQTSPDAICVNRLSDGVYTDVNDGFVELTGFTREEVIGKSSMLINIWNDPSDRDQVIAGLEEHAKLRNAEFQFRRKDGSLRTGLLSARLIDLNGVPHILSVTRDIEDWKNDKLALQEKTLLFNSLIEALPDSVYFKDINRKHLFVNGSYAAFFGLNREDIIGKTMEEFLPSEKTQQSRCTDEAVIASKTPVSVEHSWVSQQSETWIFDTRKFPILDDQGNIIAVGGISRDRTERKRWEEQIEAALREKEAIEARFESFMDHSPLLAFMIDTDNKRVYVNKRYEEMLERNGSEIMGRPGAELFPAHIASKFCEQNAAVLSLDKEIEAIDVLYNSDGTPSYWHTFKFPVFDATGHKYVGGISLEITQQQQLEEELRKKESDYRTLIEVINGGLAVVDENLIITYANDKLCELLGLSSHDICGKSGFYFHDDAGKAKAREKLDHRKRGIALTESYETSLIDANGNPIPVIQSSSALFDDQGCFKGVLAFFTDISDLKRTEQLLKQSLKEKEVLLREVHHRVKNNLAVIDSLINLQRIYANNDVLTALLEDTGRRIRSMALAHEMLYQTDNLAEISLREYIRRLISHLSVSTSGINSSILFKQDVEDVSFSMETTVPLGLILAELVSNCIKHAFPDGRVGEVRISFRSAGENEFELSVADNGMGLPEGINLEKPKSLGLELIRILAKQLGGSVEFGRVEGTEIRVRLKH